MNRQSTAVLDHEDVDERPGDSYRAGSDMGRLGDRLADRQTPVPKRVLRRVTPDDYDDERADGGFLRSQTRIRVRQGLIPESLWGKIFAGCGVFILMGAVMAGMMVVRNFLLHDPRFLIDSSSDIQINGNSHVSRPQLLSIFGEDIGRNLFYVPLTQRRAELETLPWVEHATVMRLLPDRLRVSVVERTPVAFVRQDGRIGLVDAYGVLLDLPSDDPAGAKYSFPVLTGIVAADPLSTRAARMKIYQQFIKDLDSSGPQLSETLSEVDVSNPEDVKALIPDHSSEILVHFGDEDFLERYQRYQQQLPAWRAQYPKLASVDMRYQSQVVLDMAPGTDANATVPDASATPTAAPAATVSVPAVSEPAAPVTNPASGKKSAATPMVPPIAAAKTAPVVAKTAAVPVAVKAAVPVASKATVPVATKATAPSVAKTTTPAAATPKTAAVQPSLQHPLTQSFDVPAKKRPVTKAKAAKAKAKPAVVKSKAKAAVPVKTTPAQVD